MFDMLGKLGEVKRKMEEIKSRLNSVYVDGSAGSGKVKITLTANRAVKEVFIDPSLCNEHSREELQDLLELAMNDALVKAENVSETEMKSAGRDLLPGFPGL
jgi:DNA-binding YbaB/EbfC family protein